MIEPVVLVALVTAVFSGILGLLGYRRSRQNDEVAERAGIATTQSASIGQVIEGQDLLIKNLQEVNRGLRDDVKELNVKLDRIIAECQELRRELADLSRVANIPPAPG